MLFIIRLFLFFSIGVVLDKIYRGKRFLLSDFAAEYAREGAKKRKEAKKKGDLVMDTLIKLSMNAPYGKMIEDVRKYSDTKLIQRGYAFAKAASSPSYKGANIINEELAVVNFHKTKAEFSKPIQVGVIILEEAKYLLYKFHYLMKDKFGDDLSLLLTDTDSLVYQFKGKDLLSFFNQQELSEYFDLSPLLPSHEYFSESNKKVPGKMKVEHGDKEIEEFIGLGPKMYHISFVGDGIPEVKAKGVPRETAKREFKRQSYYDALFGDEQTVVGFRNIGSKDQQLVTNEMTKIGLSAKDNKLLVREDRIHTFAWGHQNIKDEGAFEWLEKMNAR